MKTCGFLALLLAGWCTTGVAFAQTTPPATPPKVDAKRVETLVKQLGSSRYVEREDAQKELESIGGPALESLRKAVKDGDPEISRRAGDMINRIEEKITTEKLLAPKMVKLSLKDVSVQAAVEELKKQSGYDVKLEADPAALADRKITLETGEVTFFEALDKLCAKAGLTEKWQAQPGRTGGFGNPNPIGGVRPPIKPRPLPVVPNPANPGNPNPAPAPVPPPVNPPQIQPVPLNPARQPGLPRIQPIQPVPQQDARLKQLEEISKKLKDMDAQIQAQLGGQPGMAPADIAPIMKALEAQLKALDAQVQAGANGQGGIGLPGMPGMPAIGGIGGIGGNGGFMQPAFRIAGNVPQNVPQELALIDGKHQDLPTSYAGAVRVRLLAPEAGTKSKEGEALLVFEVTAEQQLGSVSIQGASITKAVDDKGQTLTMVDPGAAAVNAPANPQPNVAQPAIRRAFAPQPTGGSRTITVPVKLGEKQAKNLKDLTGTLTVEVQLPPAVVASIDDVLKAQNKSVKAKNNDTMLTLVSIEKAGDGVYRVRYSVEGDNGMQGGMGGMNAGGAIIMINGQIQGGGMQGLPGMNNSHNGTPQLVDANGKAYKIGANLGTSMNFDNGAVKRTIGYEYRADAGQGEPARLELVGTRSTNVAVPFTFKDAPLP